MLDAFGWVFSVIMLAGGYGVAHKRVWGLVALFAGNVGWAAIGWSVGLWSLFGVSVAFAAMDVYGVFKWRK
jgi:hypothetical protein